MSTPDNNQDGDEISIAGWIYADLLLALSIIGLGAASFAITKDKVPSLNAVPTTNSTTTVPKVRSANLSCDEMVFRFTSSELKNNPTELGQRFDQEVLQYTQSRNLASAKVGIMLLYGGYDTQQERTLDGKSRADEAASIIRKFSTQISNVETRTGGAASITDGGQKLEIGGSGDFAIVAYLVYDGDPTSSGC